MSGFFGGLLGLSLGKIKTALRSREFSTSDLLFKQITRLRKQLDEQRRLCEHLERIAAGPDKKMPPNPSEFLAVISETQMIEKIEAIQKEWPALIRKIQEEQENGTDPKSPEVKMLVARHEELLFQFHGGDPDMIESMKKLYRGMSDRITTEYEFPMTRKTGEFMKEAMKNDRIRFNILDVADIKTYASAAQGVLSTLPVPMCSDAT